jgi:hypothetical protein
MKSFKRVFKMMKEALKLPPLQEEDFTKDDGDSEADGDSDSA